MKTKIIILFLGLVLAVASCSVQDDEPSLQVDKVKLVNKKWYLKGKSGQSWVFYKSDGTWDDHLGDKGSWVLTNGNIVKISAEQAFLKNWEEEILGLTDSYMKKKTKGTNIVMEYSTAP